MSHNKNADTSGKEDKNKNADASEGKEESGRVLNVRLPFCCPGYERLTSQTNVNPVRWRVARTPDRRGLKEMWEDSYCFVLIPPAPCSISSIAIRNSGTAFVSVHAATIEQAHDYMLRTDATRAALQAKQRAARPPPGTEIAQKDISDDGKGLMAEGGDASDDCMSFPASSAVAAKDNTVETVGELIGKWSVVVPKTQLLSPEQLVGQTKGKIDGVRTWRTTFPTPFHQHPAALIAIRCSPFLDSPANMPGPPTVGLHWIAIFGRELGWKQQPPPAQQPTQ